jgi:hypothetical protein
MIIDLSNFYLKTPMTQQEYMQLKITDIPEEIIEQYKLKDIETSDGFIYCEIKKECTAYHNPA